MARMKLARGRISFQEIVCRMTITRRRFAQLGMGAACCLSTESLLAQGLSTHSAKPLPRSAASGRPFHAHFADVGRDAGLRAPVIYGSGEETKYILETTGCGCAFIDYDNDGWMDIFVLSGTRLEGAPEGATNRLYKNNRDGTFTDVTEKAGLRSVGWACGVCIGDYNNDGFDDIFIARFGQNLLYRNNGDGTFTDVTKAAGLWSQERLWGAGCSFVDFDRDGHLDLFVSNYVRFSFEEAPAPGQNSSCIWLGIPVACGPRGLPTGRHWLYRNNGDGTFTDDRNILYRNDGKGYFIDETASSRLGVETRYVCWGAGIVDLDNDGYPDLFMTTGHVDPKVEKRLPQYPNKTPRAVFRNLGQGVFEELIAEAGPGVAALHCSRGCAFGDFDNDGDVDLVIVNLNEPPSLLRNDFTGKANWIKIKLEGVKSNRSAIGARVLARYGGKTQAQALLSQSSFFSCNDPRLHFGLGPSVSADLEIFWPSGLHEIHKGIHANRLVTIREGVGVVPNRGWSKS